MLIPQEALPYFENAIYLPLLLTVLVRDRSAIESGDFKFKSPYIKIIERAEMLVRNDLKVTNTYLRNNKMKLIKFGNDGSFTEFEFVYDGYSDKRRYLNIRLRNRTEELLAYYLIGDCTITNRQQEPSDYS